MSAGIESQNQHQQHQREYQHQYEYKYPYPITSCVRIDCGSIKHANMIKQALEVDEEIQPTRISKDIQVEDTFLIIYFSATELKLLRVAMSSFFDMVIVCTKTLLEFGDQ